MGVGEALGARGGSLGSLGAGGAPGLPPGLAAQGATPTSFIIFSFFFLRLSCCFLLQPEVLGGGISPGLKSCHGPALTNAACAVWGHMRPAGAEPSPHCCLQVLPSANL